MKQSKSWLTRGAFALAVGLMTPWTAQAGVYDISVDRVSIDTGDFQKEGIGYNGASLGPVLRFKEGEDVTINVTNNLEESTSIHWHGLILPYTMDGVPTVSFGGIAPGQTFTYKFPVVQSGTCGAAPLLEYAGGLLVAHRSFSDLLSDTPPRPPRRRCNKINVKYSLLTQCRQKVHRPELRHGPRRDLAIVSALT